MKLLLILQFTGALQLGIAALNLFLIRLMKWGEDLNRMPLLLREVFTVHAWFISMTLLIFGVLTLRFAEPIANGHLAVYRWLAAGIGLFWGLRAVLQITYYSSTHWRGRTGRTIIHVTLLCVYGAMAVIYLWAAFR